ncbi:ferric iron siderophore receptor [Komagataeibacter intermedius AF2]|uniref:Ferric iron siderophore receptor n=1 Tax=Komagataeibacter intermedius AF2 TaxID=1458464 RepID=A0A0N1FAK3_9PROT|nr:ferric iron siderophore receptor [Komagataeibacter intermedius AF2]
MSGATDMADTVESAVASVPSSFADWQRGQRRLARREDTLRWGLSFLAVLMVCGGSIWWIMRLPPPVMAEPEAPPAAIAIDMAPEPVSTPMPPTDAPIGPRQTLSIPDPQPDPPPKVTAPPAPAPNPPVPVPREEKRKIPKTKKKPTLLQKKPVPDKTPPAEATTAPPSTEAPPALTQAAPAPGSSSARAARDPATWQGALLAQLEKFKRYPAAAMSDQQEGVPTVTFSMDRKGHVLSVRLSSSSGHPMLDQEAIALPGRAQPLPMPPDSVAGDPITLTVPVEFYLHQN